MIICWLASPMINKTVQEQFSYASAALTLQI